MRVSYGVESAPRLQLIIGAYEIKVSSSGDYKTSTPIEFGNATDHYLYYDDQMTINEIPQTMTGKGGGVWGGFTSSKQGDKIVSEYFFIGKQEDYNKYLDNRNEDGELKIGSVVPKP